MTYPERPLDSERPEYSELILNVHAEFHLPSKCKTKDILRCCVVNGKSFKIWWYIDLSRTVPNVQSIQDFLIDLYSSYVMFEF